MEKKKQNHINTGTKLKIEETSHALSDKTFFEHRGTKAQSRYRAANIAVG